MLRFFCWKCDGELAVVNNEHAMVLMWIQCPNQSCQQMNAVTYHFPCAKMEVK